MRPKQTAKPAAPITPAVLKLDLRQFTVLVDEQRPAVLAVGNAVVSRLRVPTLRERLREDPGELDVLLAGAITFQRPTAETEVELSVGARLLKRARVFGDRLWLPAVLTPIVPSEPMPERITPTLCSC